MAIRSNVDVSKVKETAQAFTANIAEVVIGKQASVELMFVALLCEGHMLLEDVPGLGKTLLAKAVSRTLNCEYKRIQCTPDLLPSDVTGIHFFNQMTSAFEFRPGPVITNILLVDEINRALPRTQSCLLECMQEKQISVDIDTVALPRPFMIIATQNPIEMEGTFPLPEAQLDRFLMRISLGYPTQKEEFEILARFQQDDPLENLIGKIDADQILALRNICRKVHLQDSVRRYIIDLCAALREHPEVKMGVSPRASLGLQAAAQAMAALRGRDFVLPDDIKELAQPVLAHRILLKTDARLKERTESDIVKDALTAVKVPIGE